jgi:hypothetical protein
MDALAGVFERLEKRSVRLPPLHFQLTKLMMSDRLESPIEPSYYGRDRVRVAGWLGPTQGNFYLQISGQCGSVFRRCSDLAILLVVASSGVRYNARYVPTSIGRWRQ